MQGSFQIAVTGSTTNGILKGNIIKLKKNRNVDTGKPCSIRWNPIEFSIACYTGTIQTEVLSIRMDIRFTCALLSSFYSVFLKQLFKHAIYCCLFLLTSRKNRVLCLSLSSTSISNPSRAEHYIYFEKQQCPCGEIWAATCSFPLYMLTNSSHTPENYNPNFTML